VGGCEEVSYGRIRRVAAATPDAGLRSLKLSTRACLGPCQGRICGRTVADLLGRDGGTDHRPIAIPIRLGELAQDQQQQDRETAESTGNRTSSVTIQQQKDK
jgi:D-hydroxyproline dehydrogenase subunit alpha